MSEFGLIKECSTCAYLKKNGDCRILRRRIHGECWAWADSEEKARREAAIEIRKKEENRLLSEQRYTEIRATRVEAARVDLNV